MHLLTVLRGGRGTSNHQYSVRYLSVEPGTFELAIFTVKVIGAATPQTGREPSLQRYK